MTETLDSLFLFSCSVLFVGNSTTRPNQPANMNHHITDFNLQFEHLRKTKMQFTKPFVREWSTYGAMHCNRFIVYSFLANQSCGTLRFWTLLLQSRTHFPCLSELKSKFYLIYCICMNNHEVKSALVNKATPTEQRKANKSPRGEWRGVCFKTDTNHICNYCFYWPASNVLHTLQSKKF